MLPSGQCPYGYEAITKRLRSDYETITTWLRRGYDVPLWGHGTASIQAIDAPSSRAQEFLHIGVRMEVESD